MKKFREHRRTLEESMETVVTMSSMEELKAHCWKLLEPWGVPREKVDDLKITHYIHDARTEWEDQFIVSIPGYGVIGFIDGLPNETSLSC